MLLRLGGKSKQREKDESAENREPTRQLDGSLEGPVATPDKSRDQSDTAKIEVGVLPGYPWGHSNALVSNIYRVDGERYR